MKFRVVHQPPSNPARSPFRVVEQATQREVDWINRFLDRECLRRVADITLRSYAHELLPFLRWWESVHHTAKIDAALITESTLLDYVRFQSGQQPQLSGSTINERVAIADRALRAVFPDAPDQVASGFQQSFWRRTPLDAQPCARADVQAHHRPVVGRRGRAVLVQFPHLARPGDRGPDAVAGTALERGAGPQSR